MSVGYAIVGCGAIAGMHVAAIRATPGARLAAVASRSETSARAGGERWGVPWTTDLEALLARADVDAAVLCTPSGYHGQQALAALRHGKHGVVEKPFALSLAEADAVLAEARARGLALSTVSQRRFEPVTRAIKAALADGALGRVVLAEGAARYWRGQEYYDSADWRGTLALDGGALMNQGIHMVDLMLYLLGPVASVSGHTSTLLHRMEAEDVATASLRFASGGQGTIVATTCAHPGFAQELRLYGERGHIHLYGQELLAWEVPGVPRPVIAAPPPETSGGSQPLAIGSEGHARQYADITAALQSGRSPYVTGEHGRAALALVLAVCESARTGRELILKGGAAA